MDWSRKTAEGGQFSRRVHIKKETCPILYSSIFAFSAKSITQRRNERKEKQVIRFLFIFSLKKFGLQCYLFLTLC